MIKSIEYDLEEVGQLVTTLLPLINRVKVVLLQGDLGTGKTTLSKAIFKHLGVKSTITSPTYAIANEYFDDENRRYFHLDLYRIEDEEELYEIGIEDYLHPEVLSIIEWPELIFDIVPVPYLRIELTYTDSGGRLAEIHLVEA